jgi:hypothetical protein
MDVGAKYFPAATVIVPPELIVTPPTAGVPESDHVIVPLFAEFVLVA